MYYYLINCLDDDDDYMYGVDIVYYMNSIMVTMTTVATVVTIFS